MDVIDKLRQLQLQYVFLSFLKRSKTPHLEQ